MIELFYDNSDRLITTDDVKAVLTDVGAADCETLFIHSDVMFGRPAPGFKRKAYLAALYDCILSLGVKNIIVPTFTYSFCNNEDYNILNSKTSMGAFNEYIRKLPGRYRTDDPLLSFSVPDSLCEAFSDLGDHSLGEGSAFDVLHRMDNVKFLFFGAEMAECFTYVHYVEKMLNVPYRFDMPFEGDIYYPNGTKLHRRQTIHTQCAGVKLPEKYDYFEQEMEQRGILKKKYLSDKYIACISEKDAYNEIAAHIEKDINYFLEKPFQQTDLIHEYTFSTENGRITHC